MRTNIEINDALMAKVMKSGQFPSKRAAVEEGLRILAKREAGQHLLSLFGKIAWEGDLHDWRSAKERVRVSVTPKRKASKKAAA
jgi:antitoxin ParD1/3/4